MSERQVRNITTNHVITCVWELMVKRQRRVLASHTLMVASLLPDTNRRLGSSTCAGSQAMLVMNLRWPCRWVGVGLT